MPATTWSAHLVGDPEFARAIQRFLERESRSIGAYVNELEDHAPIKEAPQLEL